MEKEYTTVAIEKYFFIDELTVMMKKLKVEKVNKVLDMGCGKGFVFSFLPKFYNEMVGIDIDPAKLSFARGFETHVMDAQHTTFPDNSFDMVVCKSFLHHVDINEILPEVYRVLKPGQRFVVLKDMILPGKYLYYGLAILIDTLYTFRFNRKYYEFAKKKCQQLRKRKYWAKEFFNNNAYFTPGTFHYYEFLYPVFILLFFPIQNKIKILQRPYIWMLKKMGKIDIWLSNIFPQCLSKLIALDVAFYLVSKKNIEKRQDRF